MHIGFVIVAKVLHVCTAGVTAPPTDPYVHITLRRPSFSGGLRLSVAGCATRSFDRPAMTCSVTTGSYRHPAAMQHDSFRYLSEKEITAMTEPIVFGLDPGNSEATGVVAPTGKGSLLTIPSDIGAGSLRELTRI